MGHSSFRSHRKCIRVNQRIISVFCIALRSALARGRPFCNSSSEVTRWNEWNLIHHAMRLKKGCCFLNAFEVPSSQQFTAITSFFLVILALVNGMVCRLPFLIRSLFWKEMHVAVLFSRTVRDSFGCYTKRQMGFRDRKERDITEKPHNWSRKKWFRLKLRTSHSGFIRFLPGWGWCERPSMADDKLLWVNIDYISFSQRGLFLVRDRFQILKSFLSRDVRAVNHSVAP